MVIPRSNCSRTTVKSKSGRSCKRVISSRERADVSFRHDNLATRYLLSRYIRPQMFAIVFLPDVFLSYRPARFRLPAKSLCYSLACRQPRRDLFTSRTIRAGWLAISLTDRPPWSTAIRTERWKANVIYWLRTASRVHGRAVGGCWRTLTADV